MNKIKILSLAILFAGCSEKERGKFVFDSNMETSYWSPSTNVIKFANAHSGNHACKIDKSNPYSTTFELRANEISEKPLHTAKITGWFLLTGDNSEQQLVFEVRDSSNLQTLEWINTNAADYIEELNQWGKIELIVDLSFDNRNNPKNIFRVYASNGKEDAVYVDDIEVGFE